MNSIIYSDNTQSGTGVTATVATLQTYARNSPEISGTDTQVVTSKIKFSYRHLGTNKKIILRAFCKQSANTRSSGGECQLILGRDDITSSGPGSSVIAINTDETYDATSTETLATNHGTSYSLITVTDDVSGLTGGNLFEMSVAMKGGKSTGGDSVTMTMFGIIVVVTGTA